MLTRSKPLVRSTKPLARTPVRKKRKGPARRGRVVDKPYLAWLRTLPCFVCEFYATKYEVVDIGQPTQSDPDHVGIRGGGQKCSDREAIPLCRCHHTRRHANTKEFWLKIHSTAAQVIAEYQARWAAL
jgi:hypothetical protein